MKNLFYKTGIAFIAVLLLSIVVPQRSTSQESDFEGWQVYDAYTQINTFINFEAWIYTTESIREAFGFSYLIGYMDGVNNNNFLSGMYSDQIKSQKWYQKGFMDGFLDRRYYQKRLCLSLEVLTAIYFGFFDYVTPYRAVLNWLSMISRPQFFTPRFCMPNMFAALHISRREYYQNRDITYVNDPKEKPTRSKTDYRNIEEHKNIPPERVASVPLYNPTDKPTRSETDDRNIEEHAAVSLAPLMRDEIRQKLNGRIRSNSRKQNTVLRRVYEYWPELKRYVERNGNRSIRVVGLKDLEKSRFNMERATIEVAIPGRQYDRSFRRRLARRYDFELPEFEVEGFRREISIRSRERSFESIRRRRINRSGISEIGTNTTSRTASTRNQRETASRQRNNSNRSSHEGIEQN